MSFNHPSLGELRSRVSTDMELHVKDENGDAIDAHTPGTGFTELANVIAGVAHGLYGNQRWIAEQILIATCDDDVLEQRAAERGLTRLPPTFASGSVRLIGDVGAVVPAGTIFQSSSGVQLRSTADAPMVLTIASVPVVALVPGAAGNLQGLTRVDLVTPLPYANSSGSISVYGLTGGGDAEPMARFRERFLAHLRQPPMGGNNYDYVAWAKEAHVNVTRAWVFAHDGAIGAVSIKFVCEDLVNPLPGPGVIADVQAYIDDKRPAGLRSCTVGTFTAVPLNLVFTSLAPNTSDVRAAIEAEVKDLIRREYKPGGTIPLSKLKEAISRATGENDHVITLATNLTYTTSQYPTWGVPTWPA